MNGPTLQRQPQQQQGGHPASLHNRLAQLLQQQVAIEERLKTQRVLMQRITEKFAVLRERAAHRAHHHLSLHELLVVGAYGGGNAGKVWQGECAPDNRSATTTATDGVQSGGHAETHRAPSEEFSQQRREQERQQYAASARGAFCSFVRARVLDEACAPPDSPTQFHALTADSFYLLLPHLEELLREVADAAPAGSSLPSPSAALEWRSSADRLLRFLELGWRHFPEVVGDSPLRPSLLRALTRLAAGGDAPSRVGQRAASLCAQLQPHNMGP